MNRPSFTGRSIPLSVDSFDGPLTTAIDWLVKNIPESNGQGREFSEFLTDGFLPLMALGEFLIPALKVSVPMNPMVEAGHGWVTDWFHNGRPFRPAEPCLTFLSRVGTRDNKAKWWTDHYDDYDFFMQAGSAGDLGRRHGLEQMAFWRKNS